MDDNEALLKYEAADASRQPQSPSWRYCIILLCLALLPSPGIALPLLWPNPEAIQIESSHPLYELNTTTRALYHDHAPKTYSMDAIKHFLKQQALTLNPMVVDKVAMSLYCAEKYHVRHNQILAVIDYSLPANQKRMWVFDLSQQKTLFHTHVSHGIGSGELFSTALSNRNQSRASSLGIYRTQKAYYGREGLSLKLQGLDRHFNDNAYNRYIVIHGGWYMDEKFIEKYGRPGRSWGCPALPMPLHQSIIKTIEDNAWLVVYAPNEHWFASSKYLNCQRPSTKAPIYAPIGHSREDRRDPVFFAALGSKNTPSETIVTTSATAYQDLFHQPPPLNRMLRRPINDVEYIALSEEELMALSLRDKTSTAPLPLALIRPVVVNHRGYWATKMEIVAVSEIAGIEVKEEPLPSPTRQFSMKTITGQAIPLLRHEKFIRWLGL